MSIQSPRVYRYWDIGKLPGLHLPNVNPSVVKILNRNRKSALKVKKNLDGSKNNARRTMASTGTIALTDKRPDVSNVSRSLVPMPRRPPISTTTPRRVQADRWRLLGHPEETFRALRKLLEISGLAALSPIITCRMQQRGLGPCSRWRRQCHPHAAIQIYVSSSSSRSLGIFHHCPKLKVIR